MGVAGSRHFYFTKWKLTLPSHFQNARAKLDSIQLKHSKADSWSLDGYHDGNHNSEVSSGDGGMWNRIWLHPWRCKWGRYVLALALAGTALGLDLLMKSFLNETSRGIFVIAAMISVWYGGFSAGVVAILAAFLFNLVFFTNHDFSLAAGSPDGVERLIVFSVFALFTVWLTARTKRAEEALRKMNAGLEQRVAVRTADLAESNKQLEAFCYSLAHDLRAPLRAMEGFAHFLLESNGPKMDEMGRDYARRIQASSELMGRLVLDLLAYTDLARTGLNIQNVDVDKMLSPLIQVLAGEFEGAQGAVIVQSSLPMVRGDAVIIERIFRHLLANALKFDRAGIPIKVAIRAEERDGGLVRLWVEDNGIGIDAAYQERIFGVFEKLDNSRVQPGTGIGLAVVKQGVGRMGGRVGVESKLGEGSRFWVELPKG
ncbi:MAG: Integral rane sensor signal transduction histidine kinase [Pedosphaera sp.]|nr:Integral rane sensor signal transduction histidine kinase [Pedosphaera sp.]